MPLLLTPDLCECSGDYRSAVDSPRASGAPPVTIQDAVDKLSRDAQHASDMKRIMVAMMSFSVFAAAMFLHIPTTTMYSQTRGMLAASSSSSRKLASDELPLRFIDIETTADIFDWLNDTFVPEVFVTEDYNGNTLSRDNWGNMGTFNKVLGAVSFHVTRMSQDACSTPEFLVKLYPSCYDESSTTTETLLINFDTDPAKARTILAKKKASGSWINAATLQLTISVITLNGELPGYAVTKLHLKFNPGGYIEPSYSTTSTLLDQFPNVRTVVLDALVLLWFSPWILLAALLSLLRRYKSLDAASSIHPVKELISHAGKAIGSWAFPDGWMAIDVLRGPMVYAFYITVVVTHSAMTNSTFRDKLSALRDRELSDDQVKETLSSVTESFNHIANLTVLLRLVATAAVFVLGLRVLNTFRDHVGLSILTRTIASAMRAFRAFSVIFAVIFMAYAVSGTVLFGDRVEEFSSLLNTMKTCVNMLFNNFNFEAIAGIDYSVGYYWSYMILQTFVLLNIVLAIVGDSYNDEKGKNDSRKCWVFQRVLLHVIRQWLLTLRNVVLPCHCRSKTQRHHVVFFGRIQAGVLLQALQQRLETSRGAEREAILTVRVLNSLFPGATLKECETTLQHLATRDKLNCEVGSSSAGDKGLQRQAPSKNEDVPGGCDYPSHEIQQLSTRLHLLEQKLDLLLDKLVL